MRSTANRTALILFVLAGAPAAAGPDDAGREYFETKVRPILVRRCDECHSARAKKVRGNLRLDSRAGWAKGGDTGPAIEPGDPENSLLIRAVRYDDDEIQMPPKGKLPDEEIAALVEWVRRGAPDPRDAPPSAAAARVIDVEEGRRHWAFRPLGRPSPPDVRGESWCRTPLDRFILAKLEEKGLAPAAPAGRRALIRRAYFDLIGLPPGPAEVEAFVADPAPDAYERLVDRLLASPQHGERWARHWLDLARFAESHGFEHDYDRPTAYHYRDFVIEALNRDLPYDTFVKWQLAGDELEPGNPLALKATGFLAAGVHSTQITANQVEKERYDELDDIANVTGTAMLGLTIGCARCHDHKYDPIPQRDYYRLLATFTTVVRTEIDLNLDPEGYEKARSAYEAEHAPYVAALGQFEAEPAASLREWPLALDPRWRELDRAAREHARGAPPPPVVKALISSEGLPAVRLHTQGADFLEKTHFLRRGDPNQKQGEATQGFLQVLMTASDGESHWHLAPPEGGRTSFRRASLASWITDVDQGAGHLLARVIVNRLWQHHMGRGIVATPSDFGAQGEPPTHPELLDWLASELIRGGWRLKPIHRLIMTSAAYQEGVAHAPAGERLDPDNALFGGRARRRLEAEAIRDTLLAVGGRLDPAMYGPGSLDEAMTRRSVYFTVKRSKLIPMMTLFDAPDALQGVAVRPVTTVAPQSLLLMNSPIVRACAEGFAGRLLAGSPRSPDDLARDAYARALGRAPDAEERAAAVEFLEHQVEAYQSGRHPEVHRAALADFCQVLMGLNEFLYVE